MQLYLYKKNPLSFSPFLFERVKGNPSSLLPSSFVMRHERRGKGREEGIVVGIDEGIEGTGERAPAINTKERERRWEIERRKRSFNYIPIVFAKVNERSSMQNCLVLSQCLSFCNFSSTPVLSYKHVCPSLSQKMKVGKTGQK